MTTTHPTPSQGDERRATMLNVIREVCAKHQFQSRDFADDMVAALSSAQPVAQEASKAVQHVLAERQRQIGMGWTPEHDDHHPGGDIARAAAVYCLIGEWTPNQGVPHPMHQARWQDFNILRAIWPSNWVHPNPKDKRTNLVRAGALILAEIERIDRKAAK